MDFVVDAHHNAYSKPPDLIASAPARLHLLGEHSWFFKDKTLSMAINIPVYVAVSARSDYSVCFYFHQLNSFCKANVSALKCRKGERWENSAKAVVAGFIANGFDIKGLDVTVYSDVLPSSGFGITAAMQSALAIILREFFQCDEREMLACVETGVKKFLDINFNRADFYTAFFAKKGNVVLTDYSKNSFDLIDFPFVDKKIFLVDAKVRRVSLWNKEMLHEPEYALLLGDLREEKKSAYGGWHYNNDVTDINETLSSVSEDTRKKLLCIIHEHGFVLNAVSALKKDNFAKFSRAVNDSHEDMRDLFNISCPEIDWILKRVTGIDPNLDNLRDYVSCGRISGKGESGCLYAMIRESDREIFMERLREYAKIFHFHPSWHEVLPSDGARML